MRQAALMSAAVRAGTATPTCADSRQVTPDGRADLAVGFSGQPWVVVILDTGTPAGDTIFEDGFESTSAGRARAARPAAGQDSYRLPGRPEARDAGAAGPDRDVTYTRGSYLGVPPSEFSCCHGRSIHRHRSGRTRWCRPRPDRRQPASESGAAGLAASGGPRFRARNRACGTATA